MSERDFGLADVVVSPTGAIFLLLFDDETSPSGIVVCQTNPDSSAMQIVFFQPFDSYSPEERHWIMGRLGLMIKDETGFVPRQIHIFSTVYDRVLREPEELRLRASRSTLEPSYYLTVRALSLENFESGAFEETNYSRAATVVCLDDLESPAVGIIFEDPLLDSQEEQDHFIEWLRGTLKWSDDVAIVFKICARLVAVAEPE